MVSKRWSQLAGIFGPGGSFHGTFSPAAARRSRHTHIGARPKALWGRYLSGTAPLQAVLSVVAVGAPGVAALGRDCYELLRPITQRRGFHFFVDCPGAAVVARPCIRHFSPVFDERQLPRIEFRVAMLGREWLAPGDPTKTVKPHVVVKPVPEVRETRIFPKLGSKYSRQHQLLSALHDLGPPQQIKHPTTAHRDRNSAWKRPRSCVQPATKWSEPRRRARGFPFGSAGRHARFG